MQAAKMNVLCRVAALSFREKAEELCYSGRPQSKAILTPHQKELVKVVQAFN